jgi:hypothetical protein
LLIVTIEAGCCTIRETLGSVDLKMTAGAQAVDNDRDVFRTGYTCRWNDESFDTSGSSRFADEVRRGRFRRSGEGAPFCDEVVGVDPQGVAVFVGGEIDDRLEIDGDRDMNRRRMPLRNSPARRWINDDHAPFT